MNSHEHYDHTFNALIPREVAETKRCGTVERKAQGEWGLGGWEAYTILANYCMEFLGPRQARLDRSAAKTS